MIVTDLVVTAGLAEAVSAAHAIVDLADLDQTAIFLIWHLEGSVTLWILALKCQMFRYGLLRTLEHLITHVFRKKMLSPHHVLIVIFDFDLFLLAEFASVVQNKELFSRVLWNVLYERRLPVKFFHIFELQS